AAPAADSATNSPPAAASQRKYRPILVSLSLFVVRGPRSDPHRGCSFAEPLRHLLTLSSYRVSRDEIIPSAGVNGIKFPGSQPGPPQLWLLVEPDILQAHPVVDAVDHRGVALHIGLPAGAR